MSLTNIPCSNCGEKKPLVKDFLCRKCYTNKKLSEYLDNSNPDYPGILKWAKEILPHHASEKFANVHAEMAINIFKRYDPALVSREQRQLNFILFRGAAKTTLSTFILPAYLLVHNGMTMKILGIDNQPKETKINEGFIVIASETGTNAQDFVTRIRDELTLNEAIKYFYPNKIEEAIDSLDREWTKRVFKYNNCYIAGVGVGMQIRGKIKGASRPTLFIFDDIYSENNTKTEEGRKKVKNWFASAALNTIDEKRGKAIFVNTIVHEDTIPVELERLSTWITIKRPVMSINKFEKFVKEHLLVDEFGAVCKLPYDEIEDESLRIEKQKRYFDAVQNSQDWELAWEDKLGLYQLALKYKSYVEFRALNNFYQEFFHVIRSESSKRFRREYFTRTSCELIKYGGYSVVKTKGGLFAVSFEIGVDIGGGTADSDDSALVVLAGLHNGVKIVWDIVAGKYGLRDQLFDEDESFDKVAIDRSKIRKIGILDEAIRKAKQYGASKIKVNSSSSEKGYVEALRKMANASVPGVIVTRRPATWASGTKVERIINNLLTLYESKAIWHRNECPNIDALEKQLEYLGVAKYDDIADALEAANYEFLLPQPANFEDVKEKTEKRFSKFFKFREQNLFDWRVA